MELLPFTPLEFIALTLEYVRPVLPALITVIAIDIVLLGFTLLGIGGGFRNAGQAVNKSLMLGTIVGGVTLILVLPATSANFADLHGWIDYATILGAGAGFGLAAAVLSYPPIQLLIAANSYQRASHFTRR